MGVKVTAVPLASVVTAGVSEVEVWTTPGLVLGSELPIKVVVEFRLELGVTGATGATGAIVEDVGPLLISPMITYPKPSTLL